MTAKEYLSRAYRLSQAIEEDKLELEEIEHIASTISSPSFDGMPHSGGDASDAKFAKIVNANLEKIETLKKGIENEICEYIKIKSEIRNAILSIDNADYKLILQLRFLNYFKWEQIADKMGYSERWIHELKNKAIDYFEKNSTWLKK